MMTMSSATRLKNLVLISHEIPSHRNQLIQKSTPPQMRRQSITGLPQKALRPEEAQDKRKWLRKKSD